MLLVVPLIPPPQLNTNDRYLSSWRGEGIPDSYVVIETLDTGFHHQTAGTRKCCGRLSSKCHKQRHFDCVTPGEKNALQNPSDR